MRILIASDNYPPNLSGSSYFTQRLGQLLAGAGHEVAVVAPGLAFSTQLIMEGRVHYYSLTSVPLPFFPGIRFSAPPFIGKGIRRAFDEFRPDVVHIQQHFFVARAALREAHRRGIPVVATNHFMPENITHYLHLPGWAVRRINAIAWADAVRVLRKAEETSSPSDTATALLKDRLPRMRTISNGIDTRHFNPQADPAPVEERYHLPKKPRLLFVGRLDRDKNVDLSLRAFALARRQIDIHFVITGTGKEEKALKTLTRTLAVENAVTFTGFVPDELLPGLYTVGDVFVNACEAELQGIAVMEAMATGLPIIAVRALALPELVKDGENGYLFEPGDTEGLAARLTRVFEDFSLRAKMGEKSLAIIAQHDSARVLKAYEQIYADALKHRAAASAVGDYKRMKQSTPARQQ